MAAQNVKLAGKEFVILPKKEYARLKQKAKQPSQRRSRKGDVKASTATRVEVYSNARVAEFLLSNSVDAHDYALACKEVSKMGLDPAKTPHHKPPGA